tara:strand:+ start:316 stop:504 length:189 start_codon:yes stop_codon:yes gene_type:complete
MISETESINVWEGESFYVVIDRFELDQSLIQKFNLKKNKKIFSYSSDIGELISDEELLKQIS